MHEPESADRWRPTLTTLLAGGLVIAGFLLTSVNWWFILLVAAGTFGPGVLREFGWLEDKDEFQRRADHRAGYHAFLVTGMVAFVVVAFVRSGDRTFKDSQELATLFLVVLWFTWFLSSLLAYWGPQKTASRILCGFGCAWLIFTIASNTGSEWNGWASLLLHPLLTVPFFALAWLSKYKPRITGILLLAASVFFFQFYGMFRHENMSLINQGVTFILSVGPLLASGFALLGTGNGTESVEDEEV